MNTLINIYIDGEWDADHNAPTDKSPVTIFDKGTHVQILADQYEQYIDDLEGRGHSYFCPEVYAHPKWNGVIRHFENLMSYERS